MNSYQTKALLCYDVVSIAVRPLRGTLDGSFSERGNVRYEKHGFHLSNRPIGELREGCMAMETNH